MFRQHTRPESKCGGRLLCLSLGDEGAAGWERTNRAGTRQNEKQAPSESRAEGCLTGTAAAPLTSRQGQAARALRHGEVWS